MNSRVQDARVAGARSPLWRAVQVIAGIALFLYALRLLAPLPIDRAPFVLLAAMLAAGAMALTDAIVGVLATLFEKFHKGRGHEFLVRPEARNPCAPRSTEH